MRKIPVCSPRGCSLTIFSWNYTYRKYQFQCRQTRRQYYQGLIHRILSRNNYTQPSAACTPWKPAYVGFSAAWQQAVSKCMGNGELMLMRFSFCISPPHRLHLPAQENHSLTKRKQEILRALRSLLFLFSSCRQFLDPFLFLIDTGRNLFLCLASRAGCFVISFPSPPMLIIF